jgi:parvulin-like peptidyl-prolyl isomerase
MAIKMATRMAKMKNRLLLSQILFHSFSLSLSLSLLLSLSGIALPATASAQVPSHAPTTIARATAPKQQAKGPALVAVGKPVVRVNGSVLTDTDLVREEYSIFPYARQHNGAIPPELEPQVRGGALKMIIFEELVYQEALHRKVTIPAAKLQRAEADFQKQFESPDEFKALLQSEFHGSRQALREKIQRSLLIEAFLKNEVENKGAVTPAEVRAYFDKNPGKFKVPESFTFQTISFLPPDKATPEQLKDGKRRAEEALRQAKATKTLEQFGLLAEKVSEDDYRVMMGEHKPVSRDQLAPQVLKALLAMKPGDVSDLIQMDQAYTIVRLKEHTAAGRVKFADVKAQIQKDLQLNKTNQIRAALDKKLKQNAKIEEL